MPGCSAYRELDDALGLTVLASNSLADARTGKNGRHALGRAVDSDRHLGQPERWSRGQFGHFPLHLASVLQEGRKSANIHARSAVIRGIPGKVVSEARKCWTHL
jgi:hypothetical protein